MFRLPSWSMGVLMIAIVFASLVCGAFGMFGVSTNTMVASSVEDCHGDTCRAHDVSCFEHCLSRVDSAGERLTVGQVARIDAVFEDTVMWVHHMVRWDFSKHAPPWQSHRLLVFRE